jgi:NADH-quinone oxidoreductase subunit L
LNPILFIVFLPLAAAIIAGLGNRLLGNVAAKSLTTAALFISCALSWPIFLGFIGGTAEASVTPVMHWVQSGRLTFDWALRVDTLTAVMLVVITTVSALVHLYSWGYMDEDPDQPRFFAYLSLFTFAMLMLVTANNLVQMFFGWEGVGLASYLQETVGGCCCDQGIRGQPCRRPGFHARNFRHLSGVQHRLDP